MRLHNLIDLCEEEDLDGILLNIDFEKAFDSVEWEHIYKALKFFKFPSQFITWIKCFYNKTETCVINNGHASSFFLPGRGVRQGCPLSPYLFVIAVELMSLWLKQKSNIDGITSKDGNDYMISQFADDTTIAIQNTKDNIRKTFEAIEFFGKASGLRLNIDKTEIILLGNTTKADIPKKYRSQIKSQIKSLGLTIGTDRKTSITTNYDEILGKMKATLNKWNERRTSLAGKITIIKSLVTSKLVYAMTNLPSPGTDYWKEINHLLYKFVNNGKSEKIKRDVLIGPYEKGGYRMIDLQCQNQALKIAWIPKLLMIEGTWKSFILNKIPVDIRYMARCNIKYADLPFKFRKDSIWNEIWLNWCVENYNEDIDTVELILNQNLWFNSHIRINKRPIYLKGWEEKGIRWLSDIIIEEGHQGTLRFLTKIEVEEMYNVKIGALTYMGIIDAIPKEWRKTLKLHSQLNERPDEDGDYKLVDKLMDIQRPSKFIYDCKINNKSQRPTNALRRWKMDLETPTGGEILRCHFNQRRTMMNHKIKSFNYVFMQRNIPYGARLHKMGISETENCSICNVKETILHLYWDCPHTARLWERLKHLIEKHMHYQLDLNKAKCLLGTGTWSSKLHKERSWFLCLLTKHYIHLCKCNDTVRCNIGLDNYIKTTLRTECNLAKTKGSFNLFSAKWGNFLTWLDT